METGESHAHLFTFSGANKAGMQGIDKAKQAQIIFEMSKNSAFFKKAQKQDLKVDQRVQQMKSQLESFTEQKKKELAAKVEKRMLEIEGNRSFERICCVLDMDMFFAAVEIRDNPALADKPVAVGGIGMISTTNYIARQFGVRSAMPGFIGKKLCPDLVFVKCHFEKYKLASEQLRSVICQYDPNPKSMSLDEIYFDITNYCLTRLQKQRREAWRRLNKTRDFRNEVYGDDHHHNNNDDIGAALGNSAAASSSSSSSRLCESYDDDDELEDNEIDEEMMFSSQPSTDVLREIAEEVLQEIRAKVTAATNGLTCSAGLANNFMLAKICADVNKPNGQFALPPWRQAILDFLRDLPVRKVCGIGKVSEKILASFGMTTLGDVRLHVQEVFGALSPIFGEFLLHSALGVSEQEGHYGECHELNGSVELRNDDHPRSLIGRKQLSVERTFHSLHNPAELFAKLNEICEKVSQELREKNLFGQRVTLKLKTVQFDVLTRATLCAQFVQSAADILVHAKKLLEGCLPVHIRLMGVAISRLRPVADVGNSLSLHRYFKTQLESSSSVPGDKHLKWDGLKNDLDYYSNEEDPFERGEDEEEELDFDDPKEMEKKQKDEFLDEFEAPPLKSLRTDSSACNMASSSSTSSLEKSSPQKKSFPQVKEPSLLARKSIYCCPVCAVEIHGTVVALNNHIDQCLDVGTTGDCTRSFNENTVGGKKQSTKHAGILSHFKVQPSLR